MEAPQRRFGLLAAAIVVLMLFASACTGVTTELGQAPAPAPAPALAPVDAEPGSLGDPPAQGGHQYGATLDEWVQTEELQASPRLSVVEDRNADAEAADEAPAPRRAGYSEIAWEDLIPAGSSAEELMERFDERLKAVEPGSAEADALYTEIQAEYNPEAVNADLDGANIRLAGFVAPLTYDDDIVTEFLLVPTFGACIHVPPPPPNQTVVVTTDKANGLTLEETWGAVWVEGTIVLEAGTTDLGSTGYRITDVTSGAYKGI